MNATVQCPPRVAARALHCKTRLVHALRLAQAMRSRPRGIGRTLVATTLIAAAALAATQCARAAGPEPVAATSVYRVEIRNFAFAPATLTVPAGARIEWRNYDEEPHLIVSPTGAFKASQALDTGDVFATTLTKPGTYAYYCGIHPMMVGKIVVR